VVILVVARSSCCRRRRCSIGCSSNCVLHTYCRNVV